MSDQAQVWILDNGQQKVAIAFAELVAVVRHPDIYTLPYSSSWSNRFSHWQNNIIPVINLSERLEKRIEAPLPTSQTKKHNMLCILAYPGKNDVAYGGFLTQHPPYDITISNDMAYHLPQPVQAWQSISRSCINYQSELIPILNISAIYAP